MCSTRPSSISLLALRVLNLIKGDGQMQRARAAVVSDKRFGVSSTDGWGDMKGERCRKVKVQVGNGQCWWSCGNVQDLFLCESS